MKLLSAHCAPYSLILAILTVLTVFTSGCASSLQGGTGTYSPVPMRAASTALGAPVKVVDVPPAGEANRVTTIGYHIDAGDNYILTWRYRMLGDNDLSLKVSISDITPLAVHFGETWDPVTSPDCAAAVIDGSGNHTVGIEDITPIAVNFNKQCASYRIEGSIAIDGSYIEVGNAPCPIASPLANGWPEITFDLGTAPAYEWYRVVPLDADNNPGIESISVHIVPGGGGGLVIYLISTAVSGVGLEADPFVILTGTAYEIGVEDEHGAPLTDGVELHVQPLFLADVTSSPPFTVTHSGDLTGDFNVYATLGSLSSNTLYFRMPGLP